MSRTSAERGRAIERAEGRHEKAQSRKAKAKTGVKSGDSSFSSNPAFTLACPSCGKEFTDVTEEKAFRRLDRHCRASKEKDEYPDHGKSLDPSRIGLDSTVTTPDFTPITPPWEEDEGEYDEDMAYEDHEEPEQDEYGDIPDPFVDLKRELMKYGLGSKRAIQFCSLMQHRHVHDIGDLFEVADKIGWRADQRNLFLETWAASRNLQIPNWVADEIETDIYPRRGHTRRGRGGFGDEREGGYYRAKAEFLESRIKDEDEDSRVSQSTVEELIQRMESKDQMLIEQMKLHHATMEKQRDRMHESQLEHMKTIANMQMQAQTLSGEQAAWSQIGKSLDRIGSTSEMTMKWLLTGIGPGKAPDRDRGGPSSVTDYMDPAFVEED